MNPRKMRQKSNCEAEYADLLETVNETAKDDLSETDVQYSDQSLFESDTESAYQEETESVFQEEQQISADLYENGIIKIYNLRQLRSNRYRRTGSVIRYAGNAVWCRYRSL